VVGPVSIRCQQLCMNAMLNPPPACDLPHTLSLPRQQKKLAFTLEHVLSADECAELMAAAESFVFTPAGVGGSGQQVVVTDVRSGCRLISEDYALRDLIWSRVREHIPLVWQGRHVIGPNEQLKFLRYKEGQYFAPHTVHTSSSSSLVHFFNTDGVYRSV
jgi:hypothetical protein